MPRPRKCRRIAEPPLVTYFKPRGVPMGELAEVSLPMEGLEAIRLADLLGLTMEEAAARMHVSRHTFGRILAQARRAVAEALVTGKALRIDGGHYAFHDAPEDGPDDGPEDGDDLGEGGLNGSDANESDTPGAKAPGMRDTNPSRDHVTKEGDPMEEGTMTKVAVTSDGPTLDDMVDPRFGRAAGFVIVDPESMSAQYLDNGGSQAMAHGAGIQAAERVANAGAGVVLTGFVGPKAFQALKAAKLQIVQGLDGLTVRQAVERFKSGDVSYADAPNK